MEKCIIKDFQTKREVITLGLIILPRIGDRLSVEGTDGIKGRVMDVHHIFKQSDRRIVAEIVIEVEKEIDEK